MLHVLAEAVKNTNSAAERSNCKKQFCYGINCSRTVIILSKKEGDVKW